MSQEEKPNKAKNNALAIYNEKRRNGEIVPPKKLSSAFRGMQNDAIAIIEKAIKGDDSVSKAQVDAAWKVVNSIMATERAEQDKKIRRLEEALKEKHAQDVGALKPKNEQIKEEFQTSGLRAVKLEIPDEWEDEEDLDDDNNQ
jgi:hypothetical protein